MLSTTARRVVRGADLRSATLIIRHSSTSPDKPVISDVRPIRVEVLEGQTHYWCSCGRSKAQPWCDGSHNKGEPTSSRPVAWTVTKSGPMWLCNCKLTQKQPLCDGSHKQLKVKPA